MCPIRNQYLNTYRGRCLSTSINQLTLSAVEAHAVHDEKKDRAPAVFRESLRVKYLTQRSIGLLAVNGKDPLQKLTLTFFTKLDYIVLHGCIHRAKQR